MIEALIGGERDPRVLADLARGVMRKKIPDLTMACSGRFGDHHGLLARMHLEHIDHLTSMIDELDTRIERVLAPFAQQMSLLRTIPGIVRRRLICWAKGARTRSIRVSSSSIMDVRWSMCSRCIRASSPW